MNAPLITFEGPEGGGKSTQVARLARMLGSRGVRCQITREPGGTKLADSLRKILLSTRTRDLSPQTELLLMLAARADHVSNLIKPSLEQGITVICDRFVDSSIAYQGAGRGLDPELILQLNSFATGALQPDLTILLDVPVEIGLERAARTSRPDRFEGQSYDFHNRLRQAFRQMAEREPGRISQVDATQSEESVFQQVLAAVDAFLARRGITWTSSSST